jgi:hypothetical protein
LQLFSAFPRFYQKSQPSFQERAKFSGAFGMGPAFDLWYLVLYFSTVSLNGGALAYRAPLKMLAARLKSVGICFMPLVIAPLLNYHDWRCSRTWR